MVKRLTFFSIALLSALALTAPTVFGGNGNTPDIKPILRPLSHCTSCPGNERHLVSGHIGTRSGEAVSGVQVSLHRFPSFYRFTKTDENGNYYFPLVTDGTYVVRPTTGQGRYIPSQYVISVNGGNVTELNFIRY